MLTFCVIQEYFQEFKIRILYTTERQYASVEQVMNNKKTLQITIFEIYFLRNLRKGFM